MSFSNHFWTKTLNKKLMLKNTSQKHILKNEKLAKENTKNLGKCMEQTLHTDPSHQSTGFCFPKTWRVPAHRTYQETTLITHEHTWTYMNYERFYSHNYINKDVMKKGCMTCNSSCLWKVSCCYFSGVAPLPTDNDFLVLWFFPAAFLQHCSTFTMRTGSGGRGVWTSDGCLGTGCIAFNFAHLPDHHDLIWLVLWDAYRILYALLWHSNIAMGRWVAAGGCGSPFLHHRAPRSSTGLAGR